MSFAKPAVARLASLDQFRGYTVLGMFFVNFVGGYVAFKMLPLLPVFRHHNTYCSYADTIMPQFFFAVGFAYRLTFLRRLKDQGVARASWHAINRSLGLVLIGIVIYHLEGRVRSWEELQQLGFQGFLRQAFQRGPFETLVHIGVTCLWILPVIGAAAWVRVAFLLLTTALSLILWHEDFYRWAIGLLALDYEQVRAALPIFPYYNWVMTRPGIDGGPLGFLNWTIPTLIGSLAYDAVRANPPSENGAAPLIRRLMIWGIILMVVGYAISCLNRIEPPNHASLDQGITSFLVEPPFVAPDPETINVWSMVQRCASVSYMVFSSGLSLVLYALFVRIADVGGVQLGIFRTLGSNALAAYIIHGIVGDAIAPYAPKDAPLWFVLAAFGLNLGIIYIFCRHLEKHKLYLRL